MLWGLGLTQALELDCKAEAVIAYSLCLTEDDGVLLIHTSHLSRSSGICQGRRVMRTVHVWSRIYMCLNLQGLRAAENKCNSSNTLQSW